MDPSEAFPRVAEHDGDKPRRSCFGCLFTGSLGCGAFFLGVVFAAGLFAPSILGGFVADGVERWVNGRINGELRIGDLELSWTGAQHANGVQLFDEQDGLVFEGDLRLPSVFGMLDDKRLWELKVSVGRASVDIGADGVSNLARALGSGGRPWSGDLAGLRFGAFDSARGFEQRFPYLLELDGGKVRITDARRPGLETEIDIVDYALVRYPGTVPSLKLELRVECDGVTGALTLEGEGRGPAADRGGAEDWTLTGTGLPSALVDGLAGYPAQAALGATFDLTASVLGDLAEGAPAELHALGASGARLDLPGTLAGGWFRAGADADGSLVVPSELCEERVDALLPEGLSLARGDAGGTWTVAVERFELPLGWGVAEPLGLERLADELALALRVRPSGTFRLDGQSGALVETRDVELLLALDSQAAARLDLSAAIVHPSLEASQGVELTAGVTVPGGFAALAREGPAAATLQLGAQALPARLVDELVGGGGLVPALFGDVIELTLERTDGDLLVDLSGGAGRELHDVRLVDDALVFAGDEPLVLELPWSDVVAARVVTPLLPWMTDVSKPAGATFTLTIDRLSLPLGGGWADAEGELELGLGSVRYRLHPGLHDIFHDHDEDAAVPLAEHWLLGIRMRLTGGTLAYDELTLPLQDEEIDLPGSYDMLSGELDLSAEVPVVLVRHQFGFAKDAEPLLELAGLSTEIFVRGPWHEPRVLIDGNAVRGFLEGGLQDLLKRANLPSEDALKVLLEGGDG